MQQALKELPQISITEELIARLHLSKSKAASALQQVVARAASALENAGHVLQYPNRIILGSFTARLAAAHVSHSPRTGSMAARTVALGAHLNSAML